MLALWRRLIMVFVFAAVANATLNESNPVRSAGKWLGDLITSSPIGWIGGPVALARGALEQEPPIGFGSLSHAVVLTAAILILIALLFPVLHRYPKQRRGRAGVRPFALFSWGALAVLALDGATLVVLVNAIRALVPEPAPGIVSSLHPDFYYLLGYAIGILLVVLLIPLILIGILGLIGHWMPHARRWATAVWTLTALLCTLAVIVLIVAAIAVSESLSEVTLGSTFVIGAYMVIRAAGEWRWRILDAEDTQRFLAGQIGHGGWPLFVQWLTLIGACQGLLWGFEGKSGFLGGATFFALAAAAVGLMLVVGTIWDIADPPPEPST